MRRTEPAPVERHQSGPIKLAHRSRVSSPIDRREGCRNVRIEIADSVLEIAIKSRPAASVPIVRPLLRYIGLGSFRDQTISAIPVTAIRQGASLPRPIEVC